jgi:hypothetical protein
MWILASETYCLLWHPPRFSNWGCDGSVWRIPLAIHQRKRFNFKGSEGWRHLNFFFPFRSKKLVGLKLVENHVSHEGRIILWMGANVNKTITNNEDHLNELYVTNMIKDPLLKN